jgi:hypothetical protein
MKRFATVEAMMERVEIRQQRALEQQLDLLMPMTADATTPRFDAAARAEIVSLLEVLLSDRLAAIRASVEINDE